MLLILDIVLCGDKDVDMTEYLESLRKALEERGMRVSRPKTQFMDFSFEQNVQGNRPQVKILGEEVERGHSLQVPGDEHRRGRRDGD